MILLEKIWKNTTDIKKLLAETFNLTPLVINQILSSSINLKQVSLISSKLLFQLLSSRYVIANRI